MAARSLPGPYTIPNYRARTYTVATNKTPIGPYRGVGRPGACFAMERTIDEVARAVGRDPVAVRIENMIRPERMPYASVTGMLYDNGDYAASVRLCAELLNLDATRDRQKRGEPDGRLGAVPRRRRSPCVAHRVPDGRRRDDRLRQHPALAWPDRLSGSGPSPDPGPDA
jgi:CO/xanthine dehydrogenase Mo-binding subunit